MEWINEMCEIEIQQIANKYNLRVQVLPSAILVHSKYDDWLIEYGEKDQIRLKHFNDMRRSFKTDNQLIFHRNVADYNNIFSYISSHDHSVSKMCKV